MKGLVNRFGILITASFFIMAIGIILFLLVIPLYHYFNLDTDVLGLTIFVTGLALFLFGTVRRNSLRGWKRILLLVLAVILCLPVLMLIITSVYYLATGQPM